MIRLNSISGNVTAWWRTKTVTVAVAGLSRSGKTAFITGVIANLEASSRNPAAQEWLNGFKVVEEARMCSAVQPPDYKPTHGRMFPFSDMLSALTAEIPSWPSRTANTYEAAIDIHFWPKAASIKGQPSTARVRLIFVDYPGEWLVDVPVIAQSYAEWSGSVLNRLSRAPWSEISEEFRELLKATDWHGPNHNEQARKAALEWQNVLVAARDRGLKWIQPGQFIRKRDQPDELSKPALDEEALWFCPLPAETIASAKSGSLAHAMSKRYASYQKSVEAFFSDTLKDATHHVILVDVLEALAEGEEPFYETSEVLSAVYRVFTDSKSKFWRIFGGSKFERVLMLASKADTVPVSHRPALASLLDEMCQRRVVASTGLAQPRSDFIAAVRATVDIDRAIENGEKVRAVQGKCADTGSLRRVDRIDIPAGMPRPEYFGRRAGIRTPRFVPPKTDGGGRYGIPNVRLGAALQGLFGDLFK